MTIDWSKPIEARSFSGVVRPATLAAGYKGPHAGWWAVNIGDVGVWCDASGRTRGSWTIYNEPERADTAFPEHPTPTQYAPELVTKAVDLVKRLAAADPYTAYTHKFVADARSIVSDLPQEVDPDEEAAKQVIVDMGWGGYRDPGKLLETVTAAVARGRQLQRGEAA